MTPGIEADTHEAVKTAHHGSKFGLPPDDAVEAIRRAPEAEGLHVHVGSQLLHFGASLMTVDWVAQFSARLHAELGWTPRIVDLGGGLGVRHVLEEPSFTIGEFVAGLIGELSARWELHGLPEPQLVFEPGRSLVSRAGVTLYTVGGVKRASAATTYVTVDGGMSDNPRPAMYNARYTAFLAARADEPAAGALRRRRQALRVGRRADRAGRTAGAAPRRPARRSGHRRLHARRCLRPTTPFRGRPRCSSPTARRALIRRRETVDDLLRARAMTHPVALLFDLDGTLLDSGAGNATAIQAACRAVAAAHPSLDANRLLEANGDVWRDYWPERGAALAAGEARRSDRGPARRGDSRSPRALRMSKRLWQRLAAAHESASPRLARALPGGGRRPPLLARQPSQLGLVTNDTHPTRSARSLQLVNLEPLFDSVAVSGELGVAKPDPAIFSRTVLDELGVAPELAWHIGDSQTADVAGAHAAGLTAVWVNRLRH